jgi:hypothetical protein
MNKCKSLTAIFLAILLIFSTIGANAATKTKINKTSKTITAGKTFKLKITNAKKKVTWSTSNSAVAKVTSKSGSKNAKATIKAVKSGKATITAKVGNKKFKCTVTVKSKTKTKTVKKTTTTTTSSASVYIAPTGTKYHTYYCRTLRGSKSKVSKTWAKNNGYTACKVCNPG